MSASAGPIGAELLYERLSPLYGTPMLSMIVPSSPGGIVARIVPSIRSHSRAVSSMRVPVRPRTWSLIWPLSTAGKKSLPSQGISTAAEPTQATRKIAAKSHARAMAPSRRLRYPARRRSKRSSKLLCTRSKTFFAGAPSGSAVLRRNRAIVGTRVRERKYDESIAKTTASASGTKR